MFEGALVNLANQGDRKAIRYKEDIDDAVLNDNLTSCFIPEASGVFTCPYNFIYHDHIVIKL